MIASGQRGVITSGQQSSLVVLWLLVEGRQLGLDLLDVRVRVGDRVRVRCQLGLGLLDVRVRVRHRNQG